MGIFDRVTDFFKREIKSTKAYYKELQAEGKASPQTEKTGNVPEELYTVYCFGHLFRIFPVPSWPYSNHMDLICASNIIISEDVRYDLTKKDSILSIAIPGYDIHAKNRIDEDLGIASSLEFALRAKGDKYWEAKNYELAIACYGKATQLMAVSDEYWEEDDFFLIVHRLEELGRTEHAKRWMKWLDRNIYANEIMEEIETEIRKEGAAQCTKQQKEPSFSDKETIIVQQVTTDDMLQFTAMPYQLNCPIQKHIEHGSHPFAYMDLNPFNQEVAKKELARLDGYIIQAKKYIPLLTNEYHIDIKKVMLCNYSTDYGYTRLMCTPYTFTGKISKYPLSLFFMSRGDIRTYSVNGEVFYNADGTFGKATVNIWKAPANYSRPGTGWIFTFSTFDSEFVLSRAETTLRPDEYGRATTVYRCSHIAKEENARALNRAIFEWLQKHLPNDCPKSISGFSRMKNANSKNYQALVKKAEAAGFVFPETLEDVENWPENR